MSGQDETENGGARGGTGGTPAPASPPGRSKRWWIVRGAIGLVGLFVLIQAVPYGRSHTNPPVTASPAWDSPRTEALFRTACGDCHSNLTRWPWYTNVAPFSWLVQRDVDEGRSNMNLSEMDKTRVEIGDIQDAIRGGGMPPLQYTLIHRDASLSAQQKDDLVNGLRASLAAAPVPGP